MEFCWNFVPLQVGMKNLLTSLTAMLLVIWYSLSVIGFDVHTCSGSGESYVTTVIGGTTCDDIHPEHHKEACSCCHHGHDSRQAAGAEGTEDADGTDGTEIATRPCCSDDWQMIVLTGCKTQEKHNHFDECNCGHVPYILDISKGNIHSRTDIHSLRAFYSPDSGSFAQLDVQRSYNIWRI